MTTDLILLMEPCPTCGARVEYCPCNAPTYPEVSKRLQLKEKQAAARAKLVKEWRERHPDATCSDKVAFLLAEMEVNFVPKETPA